MFGAPLQSEPTLTAGSFWAGQVVAFHGYRSWISVVLLSTVMPSRISVAMPL